MPKQTINNIILNCENENPYLFVKCIDLALTEKIVNAIEDKRDYIAHSLLESVKNKSKEDPYEQYDPKIKEAIDYVVENVLEGNLELENTILMASKQYNVDDKELKEYFDTFLETTKTEIKVDSTSSNDDDEKRGMRDDEDTNKRVRYENYSIVLKDGYQMVLTEGFWEENIVPILNDLTEELGDKFLKNLTKDKASFIETLSFCQKVRKQ